MRQRDSLITWVAGGSVCLAILLGSLGVAGAQEPDPSATPAPSEPAAGCLDFSTQEDAQAFFESEGGPDEDPHGLDADSDGDACEGMSEVGVGSVIVLAQATGSPSPSPSASASPTASASASPTTSASPTPTVSASPSPTPTPASGALPTTGGPVRLLVITAICLILSGLFFAAFAQTSRMARVRREPDEPDYSLIGW